MDAPSARDGAVLRRRDRAEHRRFRLEHLRLGLAAAGHRPGRRLPAPPLVGPDHGVPRGRRGRRPDLRRAVHRAGRGRRRAAHGQLAHRRSPTSRGSAASGLIGFGLSWVESTYLGFLPLNAPSIDALSPATGVICTAMAASSFASALWRRRMRLGASFFAVTFFLYSGGAGDFYSLVARARRPRARLRARRVAVEVPARAQLAPRDPHPAGRRWSPLGAIGPVVAALIGSGSGAVDLRASRGRCRSPARGALIAPSARRRGCRRRVGNPARPTGRPLAGGGHPSHDVGRDGGRLRGDPARDDDDDRRGVQPGGRPLHLADPHGQRALRDPAAGQRRAADPAAQARRRAHLRRERAGGSS